MPFSDLSCHWSTALNNDEMSLIFPEGYLTLQALLEIALG
jgi:hypothetical protein